MKQSRTGLLLALPLAAACWGSAEPALKGRLEAHWTGADSGRMSAPATAEWCPDRRLLEIRTVYGDSGFAVALYPLDSVDAGTYRVVPPAGADSLAPSAAVALRLFAPNAIKGYRGDSGNVVLKRSGSGQLSGTVEARSRSVLNGELLRITGMFRDIVVVPQARGCLTESSPDSVEEEPHISDEDVD